jgi:hypothetical protein
MDRTSIGAVSTATRDAIAGYRDENGFSNYDAALQQLLKEAGADSYSQGGEANG